MGSWACMTSCRQQTLIDAAHWLAMLEQQQGRHTATGEKRMSLTEVMMPPNLFYERVASKLQKDSDSIELLRREWSGQHQALISIRPTKPVGCVVKVPSDPYMDAMQLL
eukprot:scaffold24668_cov24-Tisochrysis_lutea.AAC.2